MKLVIAGSLAALGLALAAPAMALPLAPSADITAPAQVEQVRWHGHHYGWARGRHYGWTRGHHYGWSRGRHVGWAHSHHRWH